MTYDIEALIAAGNQQNQALNNLPCSCCRNVPYAGGHVEQKVTQQCARCRSMVAWKLATTARSAPAMEQAS